MDLLRSLGDFSKLPYEIRELIWLEFFPASQKKEPEAPPNTARTSAEVDLRVLRASKGLYNEISNIIYSKTHISFDPSFSLEENEALWATVRFKRRVRRHIIDHGAFFRLENSSSKRDTRFDNFPFDKVASIEIDVSRLPRFASNVVRIIELLERSPALSPMVIRYQRHSYSIYRRNGPMDPYPDNRHGPACSRYITHYILS
ncbi:hypothetical protein TEQG_00299 [Trichophyton equinum CBS 127.97]|uniref:Uncharacterized protein n=1 Tax=Trichophyton equinum (strain ATCC MYA-4606 / CBS 127.97) TaxID=559882 RepID=F2PH78_TRIEC|nr:hypothetical protein TEQG_00299 [Trichophyton equinum CBS 127.97]